MCEFVNPGVLGSEATFKNVYETAIVESRLKNASEIAINLGKLRMDELTRITKMFILRRNESVNFEYLLPKTEFVLFCKMTSVQARVYQESSNRAVSFDSDKLNVLETITNFKKIVNSSLNEDSASASLDEILASSGKFQVLDKLLCSISKTREKIVLISNWTRTLDLFETLCKTRSYSYFRLDGKTPVTKRHQMIQSFNMDKTLLFLVSAKAGGVGVNLVGASRLVLFDIDWNPAICQQSMARIWRDGQTRPVKIYRFLTTGTIEERIFQRQVTKLGLCDSLIDDKSSTDAFTAKELRELFTYESETICLTHEFMKCECKGTGSGKGEQENVQLGELFKWKHYGIKSIDRVDDPILIEAGKGSEYLSFVFEKS